VQRQIVIVDIGGGRDYAAARRAMRWLVRSHQAGSGRRVRVHTTRARSNSAAIGHVLRPAVLLHLMAHGRATGVLTPEHRPWRRPPQRFVTELADSVEESRTHPTVECLLNDACSTFSATWLEQIARTLPPRGSLLYIGTTRDVTFHEAMTYTSMFYARLLHRPLPETTRARRTALIRAHESAIEAYAALLGSAAPFDLAVVRAHPG
jgi:hypothetical protein